MANPNVQYVGLTIGPIYATISKADKTRELFAASYLFSYLMKEIIKALPKSVQQQVILPNVSLLQNKNLPPAGVGLYPDRLFIAGDDNTFATLQTAVARVKADLAVSILGGIEDYGRYDPYSRLFKQRIIDPARREQVLTFLEQYFRVYSIVVEESDLVERGVVKGLNFYLDNLELQPNLAYADPDPIKVFLRAVNHTFLLRDAFHHYKRHFESLIEIATTELRFIKNEEGEFPYRSNYDKLVERALRRAAIEQRQTTQAEQAANAEVEETYYPDLENADTKTAQLLLRNRKQGGLAPEDRMEDELLQQLFGIEGIEPHLRAYHKYVAIVHADGDRIGSLLGSLGNDLVAVRNFSQDLLDFSQAANTKIAGGHYTQNSKIDWGYGGAPIYIGGDDLLFFAPVASRNAQGEFVTIFDLVEQIDAKFNEIFNQQTSDGDFEKYPALSTEQRPCISYGITFTYVKHPLQEAVVTSRSLLEYVKSADFATRNRIHFSLIKHSGQQISGIINKNRTAVFSQFRDLLRRTLHLTAEDGLRFVNSITYKIDLYRASFLVAVQSEAQLKAFFANTFNEPFHRQHEVFLFAIRDLLYELFQEPARVDKPQSARVDKPLDTLKAMLRMLHFLQAKPYEYATL